MTRSSDDGCAEAGSVTKSTALQEFWYHMLEDQKNIVFTEENNWNNNGEPLIRAVKDLAANQTKAQQIAAAGRHLGAEVLHPDNIKRWEQEYYWHYLFTLPSPQRGTNGRFLGQFLGAGGFQMNCCLFAVQILAGGSDAVQCLATVQGGAACRCDSTGRGTAAA